MEKDAFDLAVREFKVNDFSLAKKKAGLSIKNFSGLDPVSRPVALGSDRLNGGAFSRVQHLEL